MAASLKTRKLFLSIVFIITGIFFFIWHFSKEKITSTKDLTHYTGVVSNFTFDRTQNRKGTSYSYYIYLSGVRTSFQIIPDFVHFFYENEFKSTVNIGDSITFLVTPKVLTKIGKVESVPVFSIISHQTLFLNEKDTIEKYNTKLLIYLGILFCALGFFFIFLAFKR